MQRISLFQDENSLELKENGEIKDLRMSFYVAYTTAPIFTLTMIISANLYSIMFDYWEKQEYETVSIIRQN